MIYTPYQLRAIDAFQERTAAILDHASAAMRAITERRELCFLSDRPYDPFAPSDPSYTPPEGPAPRPYCPLCGGTGLSETFDMKQFYCDCPAGREREAQDA